jgi:glycosyltransferase involved in cell wall biosynthesis
MLGHRILYAVLRLLALWKRPGVAARLLLLTTRRWSVARSRKNWRFRALVLSRTGFQQDVEQSFRGADDFEIVAWPSFALKALANELLSPSLDHNYYITDDPKIEATKASYRQFLKAMWRAYTKLMTIDVVLTGNFSYFTEREFATVLEEIGTPFIALHKENVRPPRRIKDYWFTLYKERRGKFTGRKILVYNEIERELEIASGVVDPDRIVVTGMPRLDRLHRWRQEHPGTSIAADRPHVLFFGFSRYDKLTAIQRKAAAGIPGNMEGMEGWNDLSWGRFCAETHRAVVDLARERPDLDVTVKSKGQKRKRGDILQTLDEIAHPMPDNLSVVIGGDPYALIIRSQVVVGFNTTGLLEAVAAGKPVIVPNFGEACDETMQDLIVDLGKAVEYARSPDELKTLIANYADHPREIPAELPQETLRVLRYWTGNDDGCAGQRAVEAVRAEIRDSAYRAFGASAELATARA